MIIIYSKLLFYFKKNLKNYFLIKEYLLYYKDLENLIFMKKDPILLYFKFPLFLLKDAINQELNV